MRTIKPILLLSFWLLAPHGARACNSPLVLDLEGDDYLVTSSPQWYPLLFDIDGDGRQENTGWLASVGGQGFLWLDLNQNGLVDGGEELFGTATMLPTGEHASNGFQALAIYDTSEFGGNGDRLIGMAEAVFWAWIGAREERVPGRLFRRGFHEIGFVVQPVEALPAFLEAIPGGLDKRKSALGRHRVGFGEHDLIPGTWHLFLLFRRPPRAHLFLLTYSS